jgi:isopenicillin-N epimerase
MAYRMSSFKDLFLLDPKVIFLNHGSFGAIPRPVLRAYQEWQRRYEYQPVHFITNELMEDLKQARSTLGSYLHTSPDDLAYLTNATEAVNLVARSLKLKPGDEILTSDHEYGACDNIWEFVSQKTGAKYIHQSIPIPFTSQEQVLENLWKGVSSKTKIIFISHITSPTAQEFPVEEICRKAKEEGILTFIDGAHAPGQINLNLDQISADFYTGNCHKWMMAPKGAAFLYVKPELQTGLEPLIVSWGWGKDSPFETGSPFLDNMQWSGTRDHSAFLSVPAAIKFQEEYGWESVRNDCHQLLSQALNRISELTGIEPVYVNGSSSYHQMGVASLPYIPDLPNFKNRLYDLYNIEIPCISWKRYQFLRISIQGYNNQEDIDLLIAALKELLPLVINGKRDGW